MHLNLCVANHLLGDVILSITNPLSSHRMHPTHTEMLTDWCGAQRLPTKGSHGASYDVPQSNSPIQQHYQQFRWGER